MSTAPLRQAAPELRQSPFAENQTERHRLFPRRRSPQRQRAPPARPIENWGRL